MKKVLILLGLIFFAINFSSCSKINSIEIVKDKSYFNDFTITDGKVYFSCHLLILNTYSESKLIKLNAVSNEDKDIGLLSSSELTCKEELKINPNTINEFDVVFEGNFGTATQKANKYLPEISITVRPAENKDD